MESSRDYFGILPIKLWGRAMIDFDTTAAMD